MSLILQYEDVINLPLTNEYGLIKKSLANFTEEDFCVTVKVRPHIQETIDSKLQEDSTAGCVWGRPGANLGLFANTTYSEYVFCWFEQTDDQPKYQQLATDGLNLKQEITEVSVVRDNKDQTFKLYLNGEKVAESKFNTLIDYSTAPIYLGAANMHPSAHPNYGKLEAEYFYFSIHETSCYTKRDKSNLMVELDFNPDTTTYYSIYDTSNNGNRGRINQHIYSPFQL